jgi:hypothetical protein
MGLKTFLGRIESIILKIVKLFLIVLYLFIAIMVVVPLVYNLIKWISKIL